MEKIKNILTADFRKNYERKGEKVGYGKREEFRHPAVDIHRMTTIIIKMEAHALENNILLDNYFGLIKSLSREQQIQLAARITHEVAEGIAPAGKTDLVDYFCGAWQSEKDADEMASEIRAARTFTRTIENL